MGGPGGAPVGRSSFTRLPCGKCPIALTCDVNTFTLRVPPRIKGESKIIVMSSVDKSGVIDDGIIAGADDYIRKNLPWDSVEKRIHDILF